jgi:hypothetical protein
MRLLCAALGMVAGSVLTRLYDRSPAAQRKLNWWFNFDVRDQNPEIYGEQPWWLVAFRRAARAVRNGRRARDESRRNRGTDHAGGARS